MLGNNYLLLENDTFIVSTPFNPHLAYREGVHIVIKPKLEIETAWQDFDITGQTFELASKVCKVTEELELSPWFNLQSNGNWQLQPGAQKFFHVHVYGRNQTVTWGKPITLPEAPGTHTNDPMPEADRVKLSLALNTFLNNQ